MIARVISGGQTGADRAALDVAMELGIPVGGWCPRGRLAEDGSVPLRYGLRETPSGDYEQRTEWNVRDADGTLVLTRGEPGGGTALTVRLAQALDRPFVVVRLGEGPGPGEVREWLETVGVRVLNVAGPRESTCAGIHGQASGFLRAVLRQCG